MPPAAVVILTLNSRLGPDLPEIGPQASYMGQDLLNPPSVEGWYTGKEWINSGSLLARINFVADHVADTNLPGVRNIIGYMKTAGVTTPDEFVNSALDHMGYLEVGQETRRQLMDYAESGGDIDWDDTEVDSRVGEMLALVGATTEYQFG